MSDSTLKVFTGFIAFQIIEPANRKKTTSLDSLILVIKFLIICTSLLITLLLQSESTYGTMNTMSIDKVPYMCFRLKGYWAATRYPFLFAIF